MAWSDLLAGISIVTAVLLGAHFSSVDEGGRIIGGHDHNGHASDLLGLHYDSPIFINFVTE